jgi:hypothetical protein
VLEPISPELVLVDPELRRKVLAKLLEDALLVALLEPAPRPSQTEPPPKSVAPAESITRPAAPLSEVLRRPGQGAAKPRRKRRLAPALLPVSIAVNVIVIALSVSDARIAHTSPSSPLTMDPPPPSQLAPPTTKSPSTKKALRPAANAKTRTKRKSKAAVSKRVATVRETRGKVEQKVLNTVIQSPAGKLPRALIDSRTGLAKDNLQAVCRRSSSGYSCLIQPAQHEPGEGLTVNYRVAASGRASLTWGRYRTS